MLSSEIPTSAFYGDLGGGEELEVIASVADEGTSCIAVFCVGTQERGAMYCDPGTTVTAHGDVVTWTDNANGFHPPSCQNIYGAVGATIATESFTEIIVGGTGIWRYLLPITGTPGGKAMSIENVRSVCV